MPGPLACVKKIRKRQRRDGMEGIKGKNKEPRTSFTEDTGFLKEGTERDALLDAMESAIEIATVEQFRHWVGSALQRVLPHETHVCGIGEIRGHGFAINPIVIGPVSGAPPARRNTMASI